MFVGKITAALIAATLISAGSVAAQQGVPDAGAYLAARQAGQASDFKYGAKYYREALRSDPTNIAILENALTADMSLGDFSRAVETAKTLKTLGVNRQIPNIMLAANAAATGDWEMIFDALEREHRIGPVVDGLSQGWAHLGLDEVDEALATFDTVSETAGLTAFGLYHKALAFAALGDFAQADTAFNAATTSGGVRHNRRSAMAHAQILSQLDRRPEALALIDDIFGEALDPRLTDLRNRIESGADVPYTVVTTPAEGMAEIFLAVAEALRGDAPENYIVLYARAAQYLTPDNTETLLLTAGLLEDLGQFALANEAYTAVARDDPAYVIAELGRAEALRKGGSIDAAIEVLRTVARDYPDLPAVHVTLGDTLRQSSDMSAANTSYSKALDLYSPANPDRWIVNYKRAITFHQLDQWPEAEADFRAALVFRPDQPQVLNYLGYSLVERGEKLDEALEMIEKAVAAQPQNGAIVDSLGWVLFQMGDYEEAVVHLENAAALEAVDPVINDHLGDAYWAVGRQIEARFQWNRALSFSEDEDESARIRRKLEVGLDMVLQEEGAAPINVADGNP